MANVTTELPEVPRVIPARQRGRHPVLRFLAKRSAAGLVTLLVASFVIFFATEFLPGDVASVILGKNGTPATLAALRSELGLKRPFFVRYEDWLRGVASGNLGDSAVALAVGGQTVSVASMIGQPAQNSVILAGLTTAILLPLSLALGLLAGVHAGRRLDYGVSVTSLVVGAFPEFVLGTLLILLFFSALNLLPPVADLAPGQSPLSRPSVLVLPVLTLLGVTTASTVRQIRAGVIEVLSQDYVAMAELNGLPRRRVLWVYALRNALAPAVQIFAQNIQYLLGGIIIVESVFDYPGLGQFLVNSVTERDVTAVEAVALILAAVYITINVLADLLVVFLVPKLRTAM